MTKKRIKKTDAAKVVLVDDHPLIRQGVGMLISQEPDMEVCGEADNAADALRVIRKTQPHVAVVDLTLKNSSGMELIKDLQTQLPEVRILVLSMRDEGFYAERVLRAGAVGYVTKEEGPQKVITGIRAVLDGEVYVSEKLASKVMHKLVRGGSNPSTSPVESLTDRELEIFEMIGNGLATRDIAQRLHISTKTVDSHREHIKDKLGIGNANDLLKQAIQWGQYQANS